MTPKVPPIVVALACRERNSRSLKQQAASLGMGERGLYKKLEKEPANGCCSWWEEWSVGEATRWCRACGYDFWDLKGEILLDVEWRMTRLHRKALELILRAKDLAAEPRRKPRISEARLQRLADTLNLGRKSKAK